MYKMFSTHEWILSYKTIWDIYGEFKGFDFDHFETKLAIMKSIKKVNDMLMNKKIFIGQFVPCNEGA